MTQNLPPEPVLDYEPPRERRMPSILVIAVCWTIILAIVALEVVANIDRAKVAADMPGDNATLSAAGHCIVGAHALAAGGLKSGQPDPVAPLLTEMDSVAKTPADRLRVAIIYKEIASPAVAEERLAQLTRSTDLTPTLRSDLNLLQTIYRAGPDVLSDEQRQTLRTHEDWFAEVALSYGLPDASPTRSKMLAQARRALLASSGALVAGGVGLFIGAGLVVLGIILASTGKLPMHFGRANRDSVFLEAFAVYLAGFVLISLLLRAIVHSPGLGWTLVLTIVLPVALLWPVVRGKAWSVTRIELGWHTGGGVIREIACGLLGYLAALPFLAIMLIITLQLIRLSGTTPLHPVVNYLGGGPGEIALIYFIACVWAPVFEESMFRGALFNHLRAAHGWWISASIVGLLFAAVHPQGWTTIPVLGGIGMILCALREWRGSLIASMSAHALNNATVITIALLTSR